MQLIPDITFQSGIRLISQKDHSNQDAVTELGPHDFYGSIAQNPHWRLAQWDSGPCLIQNRMKSDVIKITDGLGRTFAYDPALRQMTFELDTSLYYRGAPARQGDFWPHLLIKQASFEYSKEDQSYYLCSAAQMTVSFDIRLTELNATPIQGDWVRAAQFLLYFYVKGVATNDFCWFGLSLFDSRQVQTESYINYDGGKPDASSAMIYLIGSKHVYRKSNRRLYKGEKSDINSEWSHVEIDVKPYLEDMLRLGLIDGYFSAQSLSELCISGMNLGWETIGTFDHTMQMRNLALHSRLAENV